MQSGPRVSSAPACANRIAMALLIPVKERVYQDVLPANCVMWSPVVNAPTVTKHSPQPSARRLEAANQPCACLEKSLFFLAEAKANDAGAACRV